jgi:hypothetical protein
MGQPALRRDRADRRHDLRISAAAADTAAHELADLGVRTRAALRQQAGRRDDLARRAIAALEPVVLDERGLERVQSAS